MPVRVAMSAGCTSAPPPCERGAPGADAAAGAKPLPGAPPDVSMPPPHGLLPIELPPPPLPPPSRAGDPASDGVNVSFCESRSHIADAPDRAAPARPLGRLWSPPPPSPPPGRPLPFTPPLSDAVLAFAARRDVADLRDAARLSVASFASSWRFASCSSRRRALASAAL
eukprot:302322-Chlamydomonas_euryale.AAC.1